MILPNNSPEIEEQTIIQATPIYYAHKQANTKIVVHRGGARSGKSFSISQDIVEKFINLKDVHILIVRKTLPSLRLSCLVMIDEMLELYGVSHLVKKKLGTLDYYYNGNWLHFGSFDNPEKIKSSEWNYIFMEEATEFAFDDYTQCKLRTSRKNKNKGFINQIYISFNPIDEFHWLKTKVIDNPTEDLTEIVSNYKMNPHLPQDYIELIEALATQDWNYYRIYALGEWGRLENVIYSNWKIYNGDIPEGRIIYGLDFGFSSSQTALIKIIFDPKEAKRVYEKELLYELNLTNDDLIAKLKILIPNKNSKIYADCAEPARIEEIKRAGYYGIRPAKKSVTDGIDYVKRFQTLITSDSTNIIKEKSAYSWKKDRYGNILPVPVKIADHLLDAERYALWTDAGGKTPKVRWL